MNQICPTRKRRYVALLTEAFSKGFTRRFACREAKLHHATFYRWLERDEEFRALITDLESRHMEKRAWHRWWTHPFRGKRPPRKPGDNASYPATRFDLPPWFRYQDAYLRR